MERPDAPLHGGVSYTMMGPPSAISDEDLAELCALAASTPPGAFVEVGVWKGGSAWHLARVAEEQGRALYLYDTFSGIPFQEPGDFHRVGDFGDTSLEAVSAAVPHALCIPGVFPETLVDMGPVAFVHADCDQFSSVMAVCEHLPERMVDGGIIYFDDYGALDSADRAVQQAFGIPNRTNSGKGWVRIAGGRRVS